jgi:DMSO/TMAO reductase YedYZ heme-binding membrane subunit
MSNSYEEHKQAVSGGLWRFVGDIVVVWYGLAVLYFIAGLVLVGVIESCQWIFGPDLGWKVGFWVVIAGAIVLAVVGYRAWWIQELRRREAERRRFRQEFEGMMHN